MAVCHGETHKRPVDLFKEEEGHLKPLPSLPYDIATIATVRAKKTRWLLLKRPENRTGKQGSRLSPNSSSTISRPSAPTS